MCWNISDTPSIIWSALTSVPNNILDKTAAEALNMMILVAYRGMHCVDMRNWKLMSPEIWRYDACYALVYMVIYGRSRYTVEFSNVYAGRKKQWSHKLRAVVYTLIDGRKICAHDSSRRNCKLKDIIAIPMVASSVFANNMSSYRFFWIDSERVLSWVGSSPDFTRCGTSNKYENSWIEGELFRMF